MKANSPALAALLALALTQCDQGPSVPAASSADTSPPPSAGQSAVKDDQSQPDIPRVASGSREHTTLVAALKAAEYLDVVANAGPFTVFAPTNTAFDRLPAGTLDSLTRPENKAKLRDILEYHVALGTFRPEMLRDGMSLGMANGGNVKVGVRDGRITLNGTASIVATVPASNGIVHVVDGVLLPSTK